MKKEKGFTLIELLVAFVVLGIIVTFAIPAFSNWLPKYHLRSASDDLHSELQLTKMKAIRDNGDWAIVFNAGAGTYQVVSGGADGDYSTAGDNVIDKTVTLNQYGSGTRYGHGSATAAIGGGGFDNEITFAGDTVVFNGRGMINSAAGGYVYFQNNANGAYGTGALGSGVITLRKWNGAAWE